MLAISGIQPTADYTQPANDYNDENLFVLGSVLVEDIAVDKVACEALAGHMKAEIDRIIAGSTPYVP